MKKFNQTVLCTVAFMVIGILISSFVSPGNKTLACEDIVYGYYTISGGSSDPHVQHPWNSCSNSYIINGLDPRTVELYPTFGGGSPYTITKLSSNPAWLTYGTIGSFKAYFTFDSWGQSITLQISKGGQTQVVSFAFAP
jgi:hypothetical protein